MSIKGVASMIVSDFILTDGAELQENRSTCTIE